MNAYDLQKRLLSHALWSSMLLASMAHAATFTVSNTDDSGPGSLRQAITDANATAGNDVIDITLSAGSVIAPLTPLPAIDPATETDATSIQSTDRVSLSGENITGSGTGLTLLGSGCVVRGINIVNWPSWGMSISGSSYRVSNCYIGTDGTNALPNANGGIIIDNVENGIIGRSDMVGTGNVISGNGGPGIRINTASGSGLVIGGNTIGTDAAGEAALPNADSGIFTLASNVRIGGSPIGERNLISGNTDSGISVSAGSDVVIRNNRIGINAGADTALPNGVNGITVGANVTGIVIGGQLPALANVVSGNIGSGILTSGEGVVIQGNRIGTIGSGTTFIPNTAGGIKVLAGTCTIGGLAEGAGNTIAGNGAQGVAELGSTARIIVLGNSIFDNVSVGLDLNPANPFYTASPVLTCLSPLSGTATPDTAVEIFTDESDEGKNYLDTVETDLSGNWTSTVDLSASTGLRLTLTATRNTGGTSRFSSAVVIPETFEPCVTEGEGTAEGVAEGEGIAEGEGTAEGEGVAEGVLEGEGEEEFPPLERCAAETLGGQRPANLTHPQAGIYTSDEFGVLTGENFSRDQRYDEFDSVASPIGGLRWWGAGNSVFFNDCERDAATFRITFFAESLGAPGAELTSHDVIATRFDTGATISGRKIYRHEIVFDTPINQSAGWLSVMGIGDTACRFAWYRSDMGNGSHYRASISSTAPASGDFSYCFLPVGYEIPEGEGVLEGEGSTEGTSDGEGTMEGEGTADGEGAVEGEDSVEGALEGEGMLEGSVDGEGLTEGEAPETLEDCPAGVTSSQPPAPLASPEAGFYGSDTLLQDSRMEYFSGMAAPIAAVRWWGTGIDQDTFGPCAQPPTEFTIAFYQGGLFVRSDLVSEQTVTATPVATGSSLSGRAIYRYRAELPNPVSMSSGWMSIQGASNDSCAFYWYRSNEVSGDHIRTSDFPTTPGAAGDLSYCLVPEFAPLPGHSADQDESGDISLAELLRVVQFYNGGGFRCDATSEDGFTLANGVEDTDCPPHSSDYAPRDWEISLSELLRLIQIYSLEQFVECQSGEDGFCTSTN